MTRENYAKIMHYLDIIEREWIKIGNALSDNAIAELGIDLAAGNIDEFSYFKKKKEYLNLKDTLILKNNK
jgi:hypothetical protein